MQPDVIPPSPDNLTLLDTVARAVARARRLSSADIDDFAQTVHMRVAQRGYDVFARYEGRASLRTYLTVVVTRQFKDWQDHNLGKWRPSVTAVRLGPVAVQLDRQLNRDGTPPHEAAQAVASSSGCSERDVSTLLARLPRRPKRRLVPLNDAHQRHVAFADPLDQALAVSNLTTARRAVVKAIAALGPADARLFVARYVHHLSVARIAKTELVDAKVLYRRFDRIRRAIRDRLFEQGVCGPPCLD